MSRLILSSIHIYPIKSLGGLSVATWPVTATGLQYDRHWMLVDQEQQFLSQRRLPRMVFITTALTDTQLIVSAPGMPDLLVGLDEQYGEPLAVKVWHDQCAAQGVSAAADRWFSDFLQTPCRLVFQATGDVRPVDPQYAKPTDQTSFNDGFPFLIISEGSLAALNAALPTPIPMSRFRPNLVIQGCASYAEDTWRSIRINDIDFRLPKPCARCPIPTIDPLTAEYGKEPLSTLNKLRKWHNKVYFGQNALHDQLGRLSIGAEVSILTTGAAQPPLQA